MHRKRVASETPVDSAAELRGDGAPPLAAQSGIFIISTATLLFQVAFIRIFSASIWYHFAFLVVSVALFGIGASGAALALVPNRGRDPAMRAAAPALFALSALFAYLGTALIPFSPFRILQQPIQIVFFLTYDLLLLIPFFFSGATVGLILRDWPARAGRLYAFDLIGAACGTMLLFFSLPLLGAAGAVALAAALGAIAAAVLAPHRKARTRYGLLAALLLPLVLMPRILPEPRTDESKPVARQLTLPGAKLAFSRWSPLARIDVIERPGWDPIIFIDAAAATPVTPPQRAEEARDDVSTLGLVLRPGAKVAVIGPGGGIDVQYALALGASEVTAVEINPVIIDLVTGRYADRVGWVFADPRVQLVRDEGRSFIGRSNARFDVLELTLIDTWAASVSGAYSLSENYLYTTEGFAAYLSHLAPGGCLSITRWYYEMPRLVSMARAALARLGVSDPSSHICVLSQSLRSVLIVKREAFSEAEADTVRGFASAQHRRVLHDPLSRAKENILDALLLERDVKPLIDESEVALGPVSDESPFFFQMTRWKSLNFRTLRGFAGQSFLEPLAIPVGQISLVAALALGLLLSTFLLALPLARGAVPREGRWSWLLYFLALGVAYISVEVVLMQRLALFLGHPTYSVTTVLFSILLFSGLGSAWSDRRGESPAALARWLRFALPVVIALVVFAVPPLLRTLGGLALVPRVLVAMAVIAPLAFLMGLPFPLAVRALAASGGRLIPWAWAANGCGSVLGSVGAVLGAMLWNFSIVLIATAVVYALALSHLARTRAAAGSADAAA